MRDDSGPCYPTSRYRTSTTAEYVAPAREAPVSRSI